MDDSNNNQEESPIEVQFELKDEIPRPFACEITGCNKRYSRNLKLMKHKETHKLAKKIYKCETCGKKFDRNNRLRDHKTIHSGEKPFECEQCGETFRLKVFVKNQKKARHTIQPDDKPIACEQCNKTFSSQNTLKGHMKIHLGTNKPHLCLECNKTFSKQIYLENHMKMHSEDYGYKCIKGNLESTQKNGLKITKLYPGEKHYKCGKCQLNFPQKIDLKDHRAKIHSQEEKPFKCETCGKAFSRIRSLRDHQKPDFYSCCFCAFKTNTKDCLKAHELMKHTEEGDFTIKCEEEEPVQEGDFTIKCEEEEDDQVKISSTKHELTYHEEVEQILRPDWIKNETTMEDTDDYY